MARASMVKKSGLISNDFPHVLRGVCCFFLWGDHTRFIIWVFAKKVLPQNGWFIMENPMNKWMIWGYHCFWKHPSYKYTFIFLGAILIIK